MKRASLLAAAAVVLAANALTLIHAWRNRSGAIESDITFTERELPMSYNLDQDDSGVSLDLRWMHDSGKWFWGGSAAWLDEKILREVGFDTSVAPSDDRADGFYRRQRARRAFVALEYDGPAWRKHVEGTGGQDLNRQAAGVPEMNLPKHSHENETHLVAIDASREPAQLRARHPDRNSVVILPAVIQITSSGYSNHARAANPSKWK